MSAGQTLPAISKSCLILMGLGTVAIGVLTLLAYCNARSTVYSITSKRVLLRHGIAVPLTMNVPYTLVDKAALKNFADGTGDIALALSRRDRVGYLITWPHVRPGRFARPQPSFRSLTDAAAVAHTLGLALAAQTGAAAPELLGAAAPEPLVTARPVEALSIRQAAA
jgi:hypothetical protein